MTALIAYPNRADECTLTGGSWTAGLPLANLQTRVINQVARSTDATAASTKFDFTLSRARGIKMVALIKHNMSLAATYRVRAYSDSGRTVLVADSGTLPVFPVIYPDGILEWEDDNWWSGQLLEEDRLSFTLNVVQLFTTADFAQYWRVELVDTANTDGYVQIGRLFVGNSWAPTTNMSYGASLGYEPRTDIEEADGGAEYFYVRPKRRIARFSLEWLTEGEAMARVLDMQRTLDVQGEVFYMWDSADTTHLLRRSFIGRLRTLNAIENPYPGIHKNAFEIQELI